jgi:hypothetical protein
MTFVTPPPPKVIILNVLVAPKGHSPWLSTCVSTSTGRQCRGLTKVMQTNWLSTIAKTRAAAVLMAVLGLCQLGAAQEVALALLQPGSVETGVTGVNAMGPAPMMTMTAVQPARGPEAMGEHRFWDHQNSILFAASAAFSAADFVVTRDNLRSGGQELNPVTRVFSGSTAGLALNFAGETAGVVGLSYFFHKTGHHRLERAVSMLNIGASAAAVSFDLAHR